ncbi:hypothetical protein Chor_010215 [Crotalus horridus]
MLTTRKPSASVAGASAGGAASAAACPAGSRGGGGESSHPFQSSPGIGAGGTSRTGAGTGLPSPIALPPLKPSSAAHTVRLDQGRGAGEAYGLRRSGSPLNPLHFCCSALLGSKSCSGPLIPLPSPCLCHPTPIAPPLPGINSNKCAW